MRESDRVPVIPKFVCVIACTAPEDSERGQELLQDTLLFYYFVDMLLLFPLMKSGLSAFLLHVMSCVCLCVISGLDPD